MTSSIKWEPIEDLKAVRDLVDRTLIRPLAAIPLPGLGSYFTLVDLYETPEAYVLEATVPGVQAGDLDVTVSGRKLIVQGVRKAPDTLPAYLHRERPPGKLSRTMRIPKDVDTSHISAKLVDGVLVVTLPKEKAAEAAEAAPEA